MNEALFHIALDMYVQYLKMSWICSLILGLSRYSMSDRSLVIYTEIPKGIIQGFETVSFFLGLLLAGDVLIRNNSFGVMTSATLFVLSAFFHFIGCRTIVKMVSTMKIKILKRRRELILASRIKRARMRFAHEFE